MNNSTINLTITEPPTDSATLFISLMDIIQMCVYSINIPFGFLIHSYVIWLIVTGTENKIASEFFNLNLSVCEIGIFLNCFFDLMAIWFSGFDLVVLFLSGLGITGRPLFQCLICVERYLAVVHPVTFLKYKPLRYRLICCTAAWIISFGSCLCAMFMVASFNLLIYSLFYSVQFLLFLSIQLFCCVAVLRALKQSGPGERGREREEENHVKRKAFHLILIITINTVIIYLPYCVTGFITIFLEMYISALWFFGFLCYYVAGFVHPILFLRRAGKLSCCCSC
nr:C-C chemokine receptor type 8-like [Misgurnus anguillicaudatus]